LGQGAWSTNFWHGFGRKTKLPTCSVLTLPQEAFLHPAEAQMLTGEAASGHLQTVIEDIPNGFHVSY